MSVDQVIIPWNYVLWDEQMTQRAILYGALAGSISTLAFTVLHNLMINPIWFMLLPMLFAGAICGLFLGWSYVLLVKAPTRGGWLRYNAMYLLLLLVLGPVSLIVFEPVISISELLSSANGLPADLVRRVLPLVILYAIAMAVIVTAVFGRRWSGFLSVLAASISLMLLLGLNISALGLVSLASGWQILLLELFALILVLDLVFALVFMALGRGWLWNSRLQEPAA